MILSSIRLASPNSRDSNSTNENHLKHVTSKRNSRNNNLSSSEEKAAEFLFDQTGNNNPSNNLSSSSYSLPILTSSSNDNAISSSKYSLTTINPKLMLQNPMQTSAKYSPSSSSPAKILSDRQFMSFEMVNNEDSPESIERKPWIGNTCMETLQLHWNWISWIIRLVLLYGVGIAFFYNIEGWNILTCFYFISQTVSTVGYGNIVPTSQTSQLFCVFYIVFGILIVLSFIHDLMEYFLINQPSNYSTTYDGQHLLKSRIQIIIRNIVHASKWFILLFLIIIIGALVFSYNENLPFAQAFYLAAYTAMAVGYGNISIQKNSTIIFNCVYLVVSIAMAFMAFYKMSKFRQSIHQANHLQDIQSMEFDEELIKDIQHGMNPKVTSSDYILHMLLLSKVIDKKSDVLPWLQKFKQYDMDKNGYLTLEDVRSFKKNRTRTRLPLNVIPISTTTNKKKNVMISRRMDRNRDGAEEGFRGRNRGENIVIACCGATCTEEDCCCGNSMDPNQGGQDGCCPCGSMGNCCQSHPQPIREDKGVFVQVLEELRDIFLESIGIKDPIQDYHEHLFQESCIRWRNALETSLRGMIPTFQISTESKDPEQDDSAENGIRFNNL